MSHSEKCAWCGEEIITSGDDLFAHPRLDRDFFMTSAGEFSDEKYCCSRSCLHQWQNAQEADEPDFDSPPLTLELNFDEVFTDEDNNDTGDANCKQECMDGLDDFADELQKLKD